MIEYAGQKDLDVRIGDPTRTSVTMVITSLTSGDVTLTVPGATGSPYTVSMVALGTDNSEVDSEACFVGEQEVSGLGPAFTRYSYTATQGEKSATGHFRNKPGPTDTYSFAVMTCQYPEEIEQWDGTITYGMWPYIQQRMQQDDRFLGTVWCDDLYYSDTRQVDDSTGTGKVTTGVPQVTCLAYDFTLTYMAMFGLLEVQDEGGPIKYGHRAASQWCMGNGWFLPQWGNHEFHQYMGTFTSNNPVGTAAWTRPNPFHASADPGFDGGAMVAWDALWRPLQPSELEVKVNDTACNLWAIDLGLLRIVSPDNLTNNDGFTSSTVAYGAGQIVDTLTAMQSAPFKLLNMQHSIRQTSTGAGPQNGVATHFPLWNTIPAEANRLITDAGETPPSIMGGAWTCGVKGVTVICNGDTHGGSVRKLIGDQGDIDENVYVVTGPCCNRQNPHRVSSVQEGAVIAGSLFEYVQKGDGGANDPATPFYTDTEGRSTDHALIITINGEEQSMLAEFVNRNLDNTYEVVWSRKWYVGRGNSGVDTGLLPAFASISVDEEMA